MNSLIGQMLNNLTASMWYPGKLNIDLNEVTMNLIPYPKLHFLTSSIAPINLVENKTNNKTQMEIFWSILQDKN